MTILFSQKWLKYLSHSFPLSLSHMCGMLGLPDVGGIAGNPAHTTQRRLSLCPQRPDVRPRGRMSGAPCRISGPPPEIRLSLSSRWSVFGVHSLDVRPLRRMSGTSWVAGRPGTGPDVRVLWFLLCSVRLCVHFKWPDVRPLARMSSPTQSLTH